MTSIQGFEVIYCTCTGQAECGIEVWLKVLKLKQKVRKSMVQAVIIFSRSDHQQNDKMTDQIIITLFKKKTYFS